MEVVTAAEVQEAEEMEVQLGVVTEAEGSAVVGSAVADPAAEDSEAEALAAEGSVVVGLEAEGQVGVESVEEKVATMGAVGPGVDLEAADLVAVESVAVTGVDLAEGGSVVETVGGSAGASAGAWKEDSSAPTQ